MRSQSGLDGHLGQTFDPSAPRRPSGRHFGPLGTRFWPLRESILKGAPGPPRNVPEAWAHPCWDNVASIFSRLRLALPPGGLQDAIVAPSGLDCARLHQESAVGAQPLIFCCGRQVSCAGLLFFFVRFPDWFPFSLRCFLDLMDNRANVGTMWNMFFTLPSPIAAPSMPGRHSPQYLARRNARSD